MVANDSTLVSNTTFSDVENSFLQKIASKPRFIPYTDTVQWVMDNISIVDRHIIKNKHTFIGYFSNENLRRMYHLPQPQCKYDKEYIEAFLKEHGHASEPIRGWRKDSNKQKIEEIGKYVVDSLVGPYSQIVAMMCRLHALPNVQKLPDQWVTLINGALEGFIFDWAIILSNNLSTHILAFRSKCKVSGNIFCPFYMSSYVMDALCFSMDFSSMGWKWTLQDQTPIHIYHDTLWDSKYHQHFYKICHKVILPTFQVIFDKNAARMSPEAEFGLL